MDDNECYKWGEVFAEPWDTMLKSMSDRARVMGLTQNVEGDALIWRRGASEECRWVFVYDPSDVDRVRSIYNNDEHVGSPTCFVVVKQNDPSETRGDVVFDIFRLSADSYLWHFNRVYTRPSAQSS